MWGWIILFLALPCVYAGVSLAPWVPTRKKDIERLQNILKLHSGEKFIELGCGDARVSCALAKQFPNTHIHGIELAFPIFCLAYMRKLILRLGNVKVYFGNALNIHFAEYDVIYIFGMPENLSQKILPKFMKEAKKGTRLISYVFSLPQSNIWSIETFGDSHESKIHIATKF